MRQLCILFLIIEFLAPAPFSNVAYGWQTDGRLETRPIASGGKTAVVTASFDQNAKEPTPEKTPLSEEAIAAEVQAVEQQVDLPEELKKDQLARLKKASEWLKSSKDYELRQKDFESRVASAPTRLADAQKTLATSPAAEPVVLPQGATVAALEAKLVEMRHQLEKHEAKLKESEAAVENRLSRLSEVGKETIDVEKRLADAQQQLAAIAPDDALVKYKSWEQRARVAALSAHLAMLKSEQNRLEAVTELLPVERDLAKRQLTLARKQLESWQTTVDTWRKEESKRQAIEARKVAQESHPALQSLALQNAQIADLRIKTAAKIEQVTSALKEIRTAAKQYDESFKELKQKVEIAGTTSSTGLLLRNQRDGLPDSKAFRSRREYIATELPPAHLQLMELRGLRRTISDPVDMANALLANYDQSLAEYDRSEVLDALIRLLSDRRDFLDRAIADQDTFLIDLNELELANEAFEEQTSVMREYLDQRVLWIRSADRLAISDVKKAWDESKALLSPSRWAEVVRVACGDILSKPAGGVAVLSLFLLLLFGRAHLLATQNRLCETQTGAARYLGAFAIAMIMSARWPVLIGAIGYRLTISGDASEWTRAVGTACLLTVVVLWGCELVREVCRRGGIGEKLFHWPVSATTSVRSTLELTLLVGTPLLALVQLSGHSGLAGSQHLQRLLFVGVLILASLQIGVLVRGKGPLMQSLASQNSKLGSLASYRPIWLVLTLSPLAFAVLSVVGYHFSAYQLSSRLAQTGGAIIGVILLYNLAASWLQAKEATKEEESPVAEGDADPATAVAPEWGDENYFTEQVDSENVQPAAMRGGAQQDAVDLTRYAAVLALAVAAWFIWAEVMPALRVLDRFELWQNIESVAETHVDNDGVESVRINEHTVSTTLTDILLATVVFGALALVAKRLPAVLELTVLNRLSIDVGGRQAMVILLRYGITLAGLLIACGIIRLSWSSVQWLAAAMTVGLGFGLQEIFANLVSGLIILFERPVRAGDLVTVGDLTGNVTRMQMRATTITDFDRREMIVPNKKFITDNVINWTLSDPISRVILPVGVAYGTDVRKVQHLLLRIARRSPLVLKEPAATTLFKGFGDSTLDMELRVFIPKREVYVDVVNELNLAISDEFRKANIEIAFPQRDLHIKSVETLQSILPAQNTERRESDGARKAS